MTEAEVSASLYEAHLCDAGCGDYLDIDESQYWHEGWFYCESTGRLDEKSIGSIPFEKLEKDFKYRKTVLQNLRKIASGNIGEITHLRCADEVIGPCPNCEGLHFKVAQEMADAVSRVWCIKKVILFGSVARGEETALDFVDLKADDFADPSEEINEDESFDDLLRGMD